MRIDPNIYARFVEDLRAEFGEDDQLVTDMLEGETDFHEVVGVLLKQLTEAEVFAGANKELREEYARRARDMESRGQHIRDKLHALMNATGQKKLPHALGTVSVRPVAPKAIFDGDAEQLPEDLRKVTFKPDLAALKGALEKGQEIPGARLTNGGETISVRRK